LTNSDYAAAKRLELWEASTAKMGNTLLSRKAFLKTKKLAISDDAVFVVCSSLGEKAIDILNKKPCGVLTSLSS
jgi:hypothetical protein